MVCLVDSAARPIVGSEVDRSLARSHSSPPLWSHLLYLLPSLWKCILSCAHWAECKTARAKWERTRRIIIRLNMNTKGDSTRRTGGTGGGGNERVVCLVDSAARPIVGSEVDWSLCDLTRPPPLWSHLLYLVPSLWKCILSCAHWAECKTARANWERTRRIIIRLNMNTKGDSTRRTGGTGGGATKEWFVWSTRPRDRSLDLRFTGAWRDLTRPPPLWSHLLYLVPSLWKCILSCAHWAECKTARAKWERTRRIIIRLNMNTKGDSTRRTGGTGGGGNERVVCLVDSAARSIVGSEVYWSLARSTRPPPSLVSPAVPRALIVDMYSTLCRRPSVCA